jgi:hypothetical protein
MDPSKIPADKRKTRNGYISLPAVDPSDGGLWELLISIDRVRRTRHVGEGSALELGHIVPQVLLHPKAIFRNVRPESPDHEESLCYVGCPDRAYTNPDGILSPPWPNEVYLVFVNNERIIHNYRWEKADPQDRVLPQGFDDESRFGKRLL